MFEAYKYYWENAFKYRATSTRADFWWPVLVNFIPELLSVSGGFVIPV